MLASAATTPFRVARALTKRIAKALKRGDSVDGVGVREDEDDDDDTDDDDDETEDGEDDLAIEMRAKAYVEIYEEIVRRIKARKDDGGYGKPLVIGVSAPQGCGKTTLARALVGLVRATPRKAVSDVVDGEVAKGRLNAVALSIDDFYLRGEEQAAFAAARPANAMLRHRGNAGTHDLALGTRTLDALGRLNDAGASTSSVRVPRYDKTAREGRGDRAPESAWDVVSAPLDVILLEGWMLGFSPIDDDAALSKINKDLLDVNEYLRAYESSWWSPGRVDWWVILKVSDPSWVYAWRLEAERKAHGNKGLSDNQVIDFVDRFMPAYEAYLPKLYAAPPRPARVISVDSRRGMGAFVSVE